MTTYNSYAVRYIQQTSSTSYGERTERLIARSEDEAKDIVRNKMKNSRIINVIKS